MQSTSNKISIVSLTIAILGMLLVLLVGVSPYYYQADELMIDFISRGESISEVFTRSQNELHPPLLYIIAHLIMEVSNVDVVGRLISVLCAVFTAYAFYQIGAKLRGALLGLIFTLIFCLSPISMTISGLFRHYALAMLFLSFALNSLLYKWEATRLVKVPVLYIILMLAACSSHFSAFVPAFVVAVLVAICHFKNQNWRALIIWIFSQCSFLTLAIIFYFSYFAKDRAGGSWNAFLKDKDNFSTFVVEDLNTLVLRLFNLFYHYFAPSFFLLPFFLIFVVIGIFKLMKEQGSVARIVLAVIIGHLILGYFSIYPVAGLRYCYFVFPFWALILAYGITAVLELALRRFPSLSKSEPIFPLILTVIFCTAASSRYYFSRNQEFPLPRLSYQEGMKIIKENVMPDDIVITNRLSQLYFLYDLGRGKTMYTASDISKLPINGTKIYFANKNFVWEYSKKIYFADFISNLKLELGDAHPKKVWFFIFSHTDFVISSLSSCPEMENKISDLIKMDGFMAFSISGDIFRNDFLDQDVLLESCLDISKEPIVARALFER